MCILSGYSFVSGSKIIESSFKSISNDNSFPEDEQYTGNLFIYFLGNRDNQEAIRFDISDNGKNFTAFNNNNLVSNNMGSVNGWNSNKEIF